MFATWIAKRAKRKAAAARLYNSAAAQSRDVGFYRDMGAPDSFDGRFDLLCLHVALIIIRLEGERTKDAHRLAQALFDRMFRSVDETLREMGVGDLGVPRHMKKMMTAFNGRIRAYDSALTRNDPEMLRHAVLHNLYRKKDAGGHVESIAMENYILNAHKTLAAMPFEALASGGCAFPNLSTPAHELRHA